MRHLVIKDGQARIKGKAHLKAEMVARMYVGTDYTIEDVMSHYQLTPAEVHSAIAYYYDTQEALDSVREEILEEIHENAMTFNKFKTMLEERKTE